ncbi:MAG: bacillithiol system redox-active protein YtxJ [Flavobacteriales bacterium CG_4_9_14_3_um_filter_40_17]|nr:MAG: bacillithiol system redox-active protein YtxJ [Flavobacteriales bacterium CG_4_9_14_3_um_filter_40_17]
MGFLENFFGGSKSNSNQDAVLIPWIQLTETQQLDEIDQLSENKSVVIFKHSTRCGISRSVLRRFESEFDSEVENTKYYFLDLLAYRDLSKEIAIRYHAVHESPQLLIIQKGKVIYNVSHHDIQISGLKSVI